MKTLLHYGNLEIKPDQDKKYLTVTELRDFLVVGMSSVFSRGQASNGLGVLSDKNFPSDKDSLIGQISVDLIRTPQFDKGLGSLLF